MKPRLSVVIPCFNHGAYLPEAIRSVEAANRDDIEIIVVDDGSTDPLTQTVVGQLKERAGFTVIRQKNAGLAAARNIGFHTAKADYLLPVDADNRILPAYIERGISILDANSSVGVVYGDAQYFGAKTSRWTMGAFDLERLLEWNYIDACAVVRRKVWEENGGYDGTMPIMGLEDWDLWLGATSRGWTLEYVPEVLFEYRVAAGSMIARAHKDYQKTERFIAAKHGMLYRKAWQNLRDERLWERAKALTRVWRRRLASPLGH
jgi:glycosyltransferase involved in cell wall biosynthesis